jgi:hypothetical protein
VHFRLPYEEAAMHSRDLARLGVATVFLSSAVMMSACNNGPRDAHEGTPISVAGCVQKGDDDFLLTQVSRPSSALPSSGASNADQIAREESRAATHTFRLNGKDDQLEQLVGKQVEVTGTTAEGSDVWQKVRDANEEAKDGERKPLDIKESDLAKIDVTTIAQVADTCGTPSRSSN